MTIDFNSKNFENPEIQNLYAHIQALALEEKEVEQVEDYLKPDKEGLKSISDLIVGFRDVVFGQDGYIDPEGKANTANYLNKRVSVFKYDDIKFLQIAPLSQKVGGIDNTGFGEMEQEGNLDQAEIDEVEFAIKDGSTGKITKAKLMRYCKLKKIVTTGNKDEIIERISKKLKI